MNFALAAADMKNKENVCQLADRLNGRQFVLLWHPIDFDGLSLGAQLHERLVDSTVVTVPTTSTISRTGVHSDKIMCLAAPKETQATGRMGASIYSLTFDRVSSMVCSMKNELGLHYPKLDGEHVALFVYSDARTVGHEVWATSVSTAAAGVPVMGGAVNGTIGLNGKSREGGTVIVGVKTTRTLAQLVAHPFALSESRTVVTKVSANRRIVEELDGQPAVSRFLELTGQEDKDLSGTPEQVAMAIDTHLGWVVGDALVIRGVCGRRGSGLELNASVQNGLVLRLLRRERKVSESLASQVTTAVRSHARDVSEIWSASCSRFAQIAPIADALTQERFVSCSTVTQISGPVSNTTSLSGIVWGADDV